MQIVHKEGYSATSAGPLRARDEAAARAARRDPAHRLQPGHHAVPAPVEGAGLKFAALHRPRRRLRPDRQADARPSRTTSNYFYNVDPVAAQLLDAKTLKPGLGDLTDEMVKRYKAETGAQRGAAARLDGLQPGLDLPHRRAAAGDQEARRLRSRGAAQGGARDRHSRGRHDPGLRRQVLPAGTQMAGQNERSIAGRDAVRRGRDQDRLADGDQAPSIRCSRCPQGHAYAR